MNQEVSVKKVISLILAFLFIATVMVGCESGKDMVVEIYTCKGFEKDTLVNKVTKTNELVEIAGIIKDAETLAAAKTDSPNYIVEIYSSAAKSNVLTVWFWVDANNIKFAYADARDKVYLSPKATADFTKYLKD